MNTRELSRPDGMTIAFHEWNADVATVPVVLQHGYVASTETNWLATGVVDALVAAGRRVIGVDARGTAGPAPRGTARCSVSRRWPATSAT